MTALPMADWEQGTVLNVEDLTTAIANAGDPVAIANATDAASAASTAATSALAAATSANASASAATAATAAKVTKSGDTMTGSLNQVTSGLVTAHNTTQTGAGTAYFANSAWPHAGFAYNYKLVTSDQVQLAPDQFTNGRQLVLGDAIDVVTGGTAANGSRIAHGAFLRVLTPPTSGATGGDFMGGSWTFAQSVVPVIGSTAGAPLGNLYGINPQVQLYTGATNYVSIMAQENDVEVDVGASVQYKWGITISTVGDDAVHGSVGEAALHIGAVPTASAGWLTGIMFSDFNGGGTPVHASGTLIRGNKFGGGGFIPVTNGVDLTSFSFTGYALRTPGFAVDGAGNIGAQSLVMNTGTGSLAISGNGIIGGNLGVNNGLSVTNGLAVSGGATVNALRITAAGTPASANAAGLTGQILYDPGFLYVCVSTNTWKRVALSSW